MSGKSAGAGHSGGAFQRGVELRCAVFQHCPPAHGAGERQRFGVTAHNQGVFDFGDIFENGEHMLQQIPVQASALIFCQHTCQTGFTAP
jgi:hypothetical protein